MASLPGYNGSGVQYMTAPAQPQANPMAVPGSDPTASVVTIDGTPVRVVVLAFAAAAGLVAFKMAGVKFNVGVSAAS